ncbi:MAG: hypothetical protein NTY86_18165 [Deltaproteobacteria bacterium]|nr:hypothetical protein [Deltaproteobacteria bacterium]
MAQQVINTIGLALNIAGVILVFFFGFPQPSHEEGVSLGLEDGTTFTDGTSVAKINARVRKRKRIYLVFSNLALLLLLAGFICQLWATWA